MTSIADDRTPTGSRRRRDSPALSGARARRTHGHPGRVLRRPGRHAGAARRRRRDGRLPLPPQRQHALALSDERRDRRAASPRARDARRLPERPRRRDRVRPEHDDAHLPPRARARPRAGEAGDEIVVTELDHHGNVAPWRALATRARRRRSAWCGCDPDDGRARLGRPRSAAQRRARGSLAIGAASNALGTITDVAPRRASSRTRAGALVVRRRRALRAARARRRRGARLRLPRLLGVQVLRPAHRRALGQARR